jgi:hypothetical protein
VVTTRHVEVNGGGKFYMNLITPLDAMMHSMPFGKLPKCLGMLICASQKTKLEPIAPIAQQLEKYQLILYNSSLSGYTFVNDTL